MLLPKTAIQEIVGQAAALPAYLRGRSLSGFKRDELVIASRILRKQLKDVEDEIARRP